MEAECSVPQYGAEAATTLDWCEQRALFPPTKQPHITPHHMGRRSSSASASTEQDVEEINKIIESEDGPLPVVKTERKKKKTQPYTRAANRVAVKEAAYDYGPRKRAVFKKATSLGQEKSADYVFATLLKTVLQPDDECLDPEKAKAAILKESKHNKSCAQAMENFSNVLVSLKKVNGDPDEDTSFYSDLMSVFADAKSHNENVCERTLKNVCFDKSSSGSGGSTLQHTSMTAMWFAFLDQMSDASLAPGSVHVMQNGRATYMCNMLTSDFNTKCHLIIAKPDAVVGQIKKPHDVFLSHLPGKGQLDDRHLVLPMIVMEVKTTAAQKRESNVAGMEEEDMEADNEEEDERDEYDDDNDDDDDDDEDDETEPDSQERRPELDENGVPILTIGSGQFYRKLMGQHYVELLTALLSPQSTQGDFHGKKVFGLFIVDHRCFVTSLEAAMDGREYVHPPSLFQIVSRFGPISRQESKLAFLYKCSPFYINYFCDAHREGLANFLLYIVYVESKSHLIYSTKC